MDYRIEKKDAFRIIAKKRLFSCDREISKKEIPEFWQKCRKDGTIPALCKYIKKGNVFGDSVIGACFECDATDRDFPYAIGAAYDGGIVDNGMTVLEVPAHTWAIFRCTGAMPKAFQDLWHQVYADFFPANEYQPCGGIDFEVYPDGDICSKDYRCELWIAVEKK
ncbi:MAG: GyrI-like domain-containing protein [Clostridia bacterium]